MATLLKIQLSADDQDLAYRLDVSLATLSRIFHRRINTLYVKLKPHVSWPDQDELRLTMPAELKKKTLRTVCASLIDLKFS